jgi:hypothetical protein
MRSGSSHVHGSDTDSSEIIRFPLLFHLTLLNMRFLWLRYVLRRQARTVVGRLVVMPSRSDRVVADKLGRSRLRQTLIAKTGHLRQLAMGEPAGPPTVFCF